MNKPYVKKYSEDGVLLNPINGFYPGLQVVPNRATRRQSLKSFKPQIPSNLGESIFIDINDDTLQQTKAKVAALMPKVYENHGLTEFEINGQKIWALNQRNAKRKFNKLNLN
jgi:hypothetical protein